MILPLRRAHRVAAFGLAVLLPLLVLLALGLRAPAPTLADWPDLLPRPTARDR